MPYPFLVSSLVIALAGFTAAADETPAKKPTLLAVDAGPSTVVYTVENALHSVVATSTEVEGKLALQPDGRLQVMVRAPVKSFDSDNSNRDAHMLEVMEAAEHPFVVFKGVAEDIQRPTTFPTTLKLELRGELDFHGRKHPETVPVELTFSSPNELRAMAQFDVSLERYEIERPTMLFVKLRDRCTVAIDLLMKGK